ncbi:MAG TPA: Sua5 family C-terminal domain-containing protein, partial [Cyclobacteriaceae bacterium]|nr:Sua5 family C-terminal domain-containing protein [Cyclobacteriaceae bacterium]
IYRMGGISNEQIESVIGRVQTQRQSASRPQAPGQISSHYAPGKPFMLGDLRNLMESNKSRRIGILSFNTQIEGLSPERQLILAPSGNLAEAAHNLFSMLRKFDQMDVDLVLAEEVPDEGLGRAINDRLRRAAAKQ